MFTFLWLCISSGLGYLAGNYWYESPWIGMGFGLVVGFVLWIAVKVGSCESLGDAFESISDFGDGFGD